MNASVLSSSPRPVQFRGGNREGVPCQAVSSCRHVPVCKGRVGGSGCRIERHEFTIVWHIVTISKWTWHWIERSCWRATRSVQELVVDTLLLKAGAYHHFRLTVSMSTLHWPGLCGVRLKQLSGRDQSRDCSKSHAQLITGPACLSSELPVRSSRRAKIKDVSPNAVPTSNTYDIDVERIATSDSYVSAPTFSAEVLYHIYRRDFNFEKTGKTTLSTKNYRCKK